MSKTRLDSNGMHWFDRKTGLNILLDEVAVPSSLWAAAPRFVSIAITNACDIHCEYCYAPKSAHTLPAEAIWRWADELDGREKKEEKKDKRKKREKKDRHSD